MAHDADSPHARGFHGPCCWIVSAILGVLLGLGWGAAMPPAPADGAHVVHDFRIKETTPTGEVREVRPGGEIVPWVDAPAPETSDRPAPSAGPSKHAGFEIPVVLCVPFGLLLASIALMPFISARFWHDHYPDFAFVLGGAVAGYYLSSMGGHGQHAILHAMIEYYSFIALIGGLFVVSGGILINVNTRATPLANTLLLACGAVLANVVGTTGASMLLIRPFMRMNAGRLRPMHVVLFIFIISNCAGCLTPIGDPPLYLGYLKGVPFEWTLLHLWPMWALCVGLLLAIYFVIDTRIGPAPTASGDPYATTERRPPITIKGGPAFVCLALMVAGVFIDPLLKKHAGIEGLPIGATFQLLVAFAAYRLADENIHDANDFNFHPVKEVGMLFVGIFLTMVPALEYLSSHAGELGIETPTQFYFFTGSLSAVLDNAPTYLNFGQAALGLLHLPLNAEGLDRFIHNDFEVVHTSGEVVRFHGVVLLEAISLGAVFFGAMTYIGNGPNFMVKAISEAAGVRMPSFFGYMGRAILILLPVLVVVWFVFIR